MAGKTDWYRLAERWADRCNLCGENNQRLVSFSICNSCRLKELKRKEAKK